MILKKQSYKFKENGTDSYITEQKLLNILESQIEFKDELQEVFQIDKEEVKVIKIGNAKTLIDSLTKLDSQCEKIDINSKIKNVQLKKMLEEEKAIFEIFGIKDDFILKTNKSDILDVETAYSAKSDLLDIYRLSKFANYCRDMEYDDLIETIREYLEKKNLKNEDEKSLRLLFKHEDKKFYLRAITSTDNYRNFGINFSIFVALVVLNKYVEDSKNEIFIDSYSVDDSTVYVSFSLSNETKINNDVKLSFNLILENDEIKRNAVAFNGIFKLTFEEGDKSSEIYLKPKGLKKDNVSYPVDLLTYRHSGKVEKVFEKVTELPSLIDFFINQVKEDSSRISKIEKPDDVRKHLAKKIKFSKNPEFKKYKQQIFNKLMSITVSNTFSLFEVFRSVEELFEHDDIISRDFWRTKLYEVLVERD